MCKSPVEASNHITAIFSMTISKSQTCSKLSLYSPSSGLLQAYKPEVGRCLISCFSPLTLPLTILRAVSDLSPLCQGGKRKRRKGNSPICLLLCHLASVPSGYGEFKADSFQIFSQKSPLLPHTPTVVPRW